MIITKEIKEISDIQNKVYVIYRKSALIEKYIKKMGYSFINHGVIKSQLTLAKELFWI